MRPEDTKYMIFLAKSIKIFIFFLFNLPKIKIKAEIYAGFGKPGGKAVRPPPARKGAPGLPDGRKAGFGAGNEVVFPH